MNLVPSGSSFLQWEEHHFRTQRAPGSTFTFTIVSDSHLGQYGGQTTDELALYKQTLQNIEQDNPDFHIDLGDTYAMDPSPLGTGMTEEEARTAYMVERPFLGMIYAIRSLSFNAWEIMRMKKAGISMTLLLHRTNPLPLSA